MNTERFWEVFRGDGCFYILQHDYLNPEADRFNKTKADWCHANRDRVNFKTDVMTRRMQIDKTIYFIRDIAYLNAREFKVIVKSIHSKSYERYHLNG